MNTTNSIITQLIKSGEIEVVNMVNSCVSLFCSFIIMVKVLDFGSFFKRVREKRQFQKKEKERKELERMKKLMESLHSNEEVNIEDLLSDNEKEEEMSIMKIARKKKSQKSSYV